MKHTGIINYKESINNSHGLFRTLCNVIPKRDAYGEVKFLAGNNSATFKVDIEGKSYGIKCYIKAKDNLAQIYERLRSELDHAVFTPARFLSDELYAFDIFDKGAFYSVVLIEWIEGNTLEVEIRRGVREYGREYIKRLSEEFDLLALHMIEQEWAHGDLKPENIMVCPDGKMKLIDYDAFFFPEFEGRNATEIGTPTYQHPSRDEKLYNRHIDDYSIALISVSLRALVHDPSLYEKYNRSDNIILTPSKIVAGKSEAYQDIIRLFIDKGDHRAYRLATKLNSSSPIIDDLKQLIAKRNDYTGALALSEKGGKWGYVDDTGRWVIIPIYDSATDFHEQVAIVSLQGVHSAINLAGDPFINIDYDTIKPFSEGLAPIMIKGKWGYVNKDSKLVIEPQFDEARGVKEGLAAVKLGDRWGYIDKFGEFVIEPKYSRAMGIREGCGVVYLGEEMIKIDLRNHVEKIRGGYFRKNR